MPSLSASGRTPLLLAVCFDPMPEMVEALLAAGADVETRASCRHGRSVVKEPLTVLERALEMDRTHIMPTLESI